MDSAYNRIIVYIHPGHPGSEITVDHGTHLLERIEVRSHLPTVLQQGGTAVQEAGAALLDARWHSAVQKLERAADTSQEYWPSRGCDGIHLSGLISNCLLK